MLLDIVQRAGQPPTPETHPTQSVGSAKLRNPIRKHKGVKPHSIQLPWDDSLASLSLSV